VLVPHQLHQAGIRGIISARPTTDGALWAPLPPFTAILYPFVDGADGFTTPLTDNQWCELGQTLRGLHNSHIPASLTAELPREAFSAQWNAPLTRFMAQAATGITGDTAAQELAALLREKREVIAALMVDTDRLARRLRDEPPPFVVCHGDIHGWNVLIDSAGQLFVVDWDTLRLAPREQDLMFAGSGIGGGGKSPEEAERLVFAGYGPADINRDALAYFRANRIIEDIVAYCEALFLTSAGGADRPVAVANVRSNFRPGGTVDQAYRAVCAADD